MNTSNSKAFEHWLRNLPKDIVSDKQVTLNLRISLSVTEWIYLARGAAVNGISLEEAVSYCINAGQWPGDWSNNDFAMCEIETVPSGKLEDIKEHLSAVVG